MSEALTLTEAAERLAPAVQDEPAGVANLSTPETTTTKGKWLSLDEGAAMLADLMAEKPEPVAKAKKPVKDVMTAREAADELAKIDEVKPYVDLSEVRTKRESTANANATSVRLAWELDTFIAQVAQAFPDVGGQQDVARLDTARGGQWAAAQAHTRALSVALQTARTNELDAWNRLFQAENAAFNEMHPDWSEEDSKRIVDMLTGLGLPEQEIGQLWVTPTPIDLGNPLCVSIMQKAAGKDPEAMMGLLKEVGFDDDEIQAALSQTMPVYLRDHRVQEIMARAANADEARQDQAAA